MKLWLLLFNRGVSFSLCYQVDELRTHTSQMERNHEVALAAAKASVRDLQRDLADKTRLLTRKNKDCDEQRAMLTEQIAQLERRLQDESAQLQRRSAEAERLARDFESAGFAGTWLSWESCERSRCRMSVVNVTCFVSPGRCAWFMWLCDAPVRVFLYCAQLRLCSYCRRAFVRLCEILRVAHSHEARRGTVVCWNAVSLGINRCSATLRCLAGDLRTQSAIDQLKEKYNTAVALLDARLRTEADQNKALAAKIRCVG
jgi:exonuclease VII large subunit